MERTFSFHLYDNIMLFDNFTESLKSTSIPQKTSPLFNDKKDHTGKEMLLLRFLERKGAGLESDPFNSCC